MWQFLVVLTFVVTNISLAAPKSSGSGSSSSGKKFYEDWHQKSENKAAKRWTLDDWFETKKKMGMMDQWLAAHTSANAYEFYMGGDSISYTMETETLASNATTHDGSRMNRGYFGAFASIVGLEGQYEADENDYFAWLAMFNLRVFGIAQQSTHLTLNYGIKNRKETTSSEMIQNQFAGVMLSIYLLKHFGLDGMYRYYFAEPIPKTDTELTGERFEARGFIDFSFLQLYGMWFKEPLRTTLYETPLTRQTRSGVGIGVRIYF